MAKDAPTATQDRNPRPLILAVDGGASKTDVVIVDSAGTVLGRSRGAASNHQMVGLDAAVDNLAETIVGALDNAGLDRRAGPPYGTNGVYCLAGIDLPIDEHRVGAAITARGWTKTVDLRNDTFAILRAGIEAGWGVAVVCGTGLNCVGLAPDGTNVRFPSLGELSGDFTPGGAWLGVRGLGLALRAQDGRGESTSLEEAVPGLFSLDSPQGVLEAVYTGALPFSRLPEIARVVLQAASEGDRAAADAVGLLADEVVAMVVATIERLDLGSTSVQVVVGGGVFEDDGFTQRIMRGVRGAAPSAVLHTLQGPPVLGAALFGLDAIDASDESVARLRASLH